MSGQTRLIAGAMSGTSADGVDVAIVRIAGRGLKMSAQLVMHHQVAYDASLRQLIFATREQGSVRLSDLGKMGREISLTYARAVNEALDASGLSPSDLAAVAAHGQTLYHEPPNTIQWFDPALVAAQVGCAVVSDFRRADCAAGGQGAPLVPFADYLLFRHPTKNRVLLNIGGIANVTWLKAGGMIDGVIAFDTGPGNCVSDHLCRKLDPDGAGYDVGGERALAGKMHFPTAFAAARCGYIFGAPPKSTDGPAMIAVYHRTKSETGFTGTPDDELATACGFTAYSIEMSLDLGQQHWWHAPVDELLVSGGGVHNACLMKHLTNAVGASTSVIPLDDSTSQAKEAIAFALLGAATLDGVPSNVPSVTGACRAVVLGSITPKP
jgi:anhydro-N-acetylmuramic acid kinase